MFFLQMIQSGSNLVSLLLSSGFRTVFKRLVAAPFLKLPTSQLLSSISRILSKKSLGKTYVCGLLATTASEGSGFGNDHWQVSDFVALYTFLNCPEGTSFWLCGTDIRSGPEFLLGDPACDRIVLNPPPFETTYDTAAPGMVMKLHRLAHAYTMRVSATARELSSEDKLCLVLCGHGTSGGTLRVGTSEVYIPLYKELLESALFGCKGEVHLITTACHSGSWVSPLWSVYAADGKSQGSSIVQSEPAHYRGGFFSFVLSAEYAYQHSRKVPKPAPLGDDGHQGEQQVVTPSLSNRTTNETIEWLHALRDYIGRTYTASADTTCSLGEADKTWMPPFVFPIKLEELQPCHCQGTNDDSESDELDGTFTASDLAVASFSEADEADLLALSRDHLRYAPPVTLSENFLADSCSTFLHSMHPACKQLTDQEKIRMLKALRERQKLRKLHLSIAQKLGWQEAIAKIGEPFTDQRRLGADHPLQRKAQGSGCLVFALHVSNGYTPWAGGAGWLARIWEAAGEPTVSPTQWKTVLKASRKEVGVVIPELE